MTKSNRFFLMRQSNRPPDSANGGQRSARRKQQCRFHIDFD